MPDRFRKRIRAAAKEGAGAHRCCGPDLLALIQKRIVGLAAKNRLPAIYADSDFVEAGGLMSYGAEAVADLYRRAAIYVDKILKGAKPADLPVEQPMKFEFIINLKDRQADRPDDSAECAGESGQSDQVILILLTTGTTARRVGISSSETGLNALRPVVLRRVDDW